MNLLDRVIAYVNPKAAADREAARTRIVSSEMRRNAFLATGDVMDSMLGGHVVKNSGYSGGGASHGKTWDRGYVVESGSPKEDIEMNRKTLRERSRDLSTNSPLGAAAVKSSRTNCIGPGLIPKPKIDYEFLGISKEEAKNIQKQIKREFSLWADSTLCDNNDQNNFYEIQQIAFLDWMRNGEEFVLIKYADEVPYMPYRLRLKLVEADRVCDKGSLGDEYDGFEKREKNGNKIINGVEISKEGKVVAYHICNKYPGEYHYLQEKTWIRVPKRGEKTGNLNILHIFNGERADQYRGVPFLAPVIETIKQLTRYTEAEIMAAVVNAFLSIFITTENGDDMGEFGGEDEELEEENGGQVDDNIKIGSGTVNFLKNGESVKTVESAHPNGNYDGFSTVMARYIGAALEIAPEVLLKQFRNNFSASKGAQNETWKFFRMMRTWFINDFCQEVYELWMAEAVSTGRITAPGFFNDPLIRKAYTNCTWNGPAQGQIDPGKEVSAAKARVEQGFSTREDECAALNGSDFEENVRVLSEENGLLKKAQDALLSEGGNKDGSKD